MLHPTFLNTRAWIVLFPTLSMTRGSTLNNYRSEYPGELDRGTVEYLMDNVILRQYLYNTFLLIEYMYSLGILINYLYIILSGVH